MKKHFFVALTLIFVLVSCSSDDDTTEAENFEFAMTAKINDNTFEANNPFGTNEFSSTNVYDYYPIEDFVLLQGRQGGVLGTPEINIWLKRDDIVVGTYQIGEETFGTPPSHFIDLIDSSNTISENTKQGTITITEVDTSSKIVTGSFEFTAVDELDNSSDAVDFTITEGVFRYQYE